jgi:hypothetical protein
LEPVRSVAFIPKTPVKKDIGRKTIVMIVNLYPRISCQYFLLKA